MVWVLAHNAPSFVICVCFPKPPERHCKTPCCKHTTKCDENIYGSFIEYSSHLKWIKYNYFNEGHAPASWILNEWRCVVPQPFVDIFSLHKMLLNADWIMYACTVHFFILSSVWVVFSLDFRVWNKDKKQTRTLHWFLHFDERFFGKI